MPDDLLLIAVCTGARCRGLRGLPGASDDELLRAAVRSRPRSVLVSTPCLGPCAQGCVTAVGHGTTAVGGGLHWTHRPVGVGLVERPARAERLAEWVRGPAPDPATLPTELRDAASPGRLPHT